MEKGRHAKDPKVESTPDRHILTFGNRMQHCLSKNKKETKYIPHCSKRQIYSSSLLQMAQLFVGYIGNQPVTLGILFI